MDIKMGSALLSFHIEKCANRFWSGGLGLCDTFFGMAISTALDPKQKNQASM
jgi:hypothetical protein